MDFLPTMLGYSLLNGSNAISAILHIPARASTDPVRPVFVDRPLWPCHGRDHVVQEVGLTTRVHLVQMKESIFAYGDQNPSEEVDLISLGLWFFVERGSGGFCWRRCGDMPTVLGLSAGRVAMIEGVQGKGLPAIISSIWCYFPPVSSPLVHQL